jgi:hypothetical protein
MRRFGKGSVGGGIEREENMADFATIVWGQTILWGSGLPWNLLSIVWD